MLKKQIKKEKNDTVFENTYEEKVISTNKKMSVEDCMETDSDNLQTVNKKLSFLLNVYKLQKKRIRYVMQQKRRLKKKVAKLQNVINELQEKRLISDEATTTLNRLNPGVKDLNQRELKSKSKLKYSPSLRTFALTLHFYSAKAYDYVRPSFNNCLPHPDTLRKWYSSINDSQALLMKHSKF
ncbi:uncharacterized protein LOC136089878 [Hydra vulgaris]|uniref:Uncharacterized protein LOC136089878 n=1 Tax=Hydra vulgaris TaxID=6087 RepID=A0ABM4DCD5_HYDVU